MTDIPISNPGDSPMYVAGRMIPAGETRMIPADEVPHYARPGVPVAALPVADPLAALLTSNVESVSNGLPALSDDELVDIETLELAGADRVGVIKALDRERFRRADLAILRDETTLLMDVGDVEKLTQHRATVSDHPELVNLIDARLAALRES